MDKPGSNFVLVVEHDREIAKVVETNLHDLGLHTEHAGDGKTGLARALQNHYALIILDLMLPEIDGMSVCARIREKNSFTPILMLTAKSDEIDKVLSLEIGADDYVTRPFSVREFTARVKALLRRVQADRETMTTGDDQAIIELGGLSIDESKRKVTMNGEPIKLTLKEFDLLALFAKNPGRAYKRTDLLDIVWSYQFEGYEHTVNSHINRLRHKIEEDPSHPRYLKTVWGVGYRFAEPSELLERSESTNRLQSTRFVRRNER